jgi:DNA adenine methylase
MTTLLNRNGNKSKLANYILPHFPTHKIYIEPMFGAGGMFFNKPLAQYNLLNDIDDDIFNLFLVVKKQRVELENELKKLPINSSLLKHWKANPETDPILKALRFLLLSNFSLYGKGDTLRLGADNSKKQILSTIPKTFEKIQDAKLSCFDFRVFLENITFTDSTPKDSCFIYFDPIYLHTIANYTYDRWNSSDLNEVFKIMKEIGVNCACSEFYTPDVIEMAQSYDLNIIKLKERQNIKNRRTEILITNYQNRQYNLF